MTPVKCTLVSALLALPLSSQSEEFPAPASWSFPDIVESALEISPTNIEGKPFNRFGIAYPLDVIKNLDLSDISENDLQKYADVVTHAYPDAVLLKSEIPSNCENWTPEYYNETSLAGMAYISLHAIDDKHREIAKSCLAGILQNISKE